MIAGESYLYDIPLYVVPTSNARTSFRREPEYGERLERVVMVVVQVKEGRCCVRTAPGCNPYYTALTNL